MRLITHPANRHLLDAKIYELRKEDVMSGVHRINQGIDIVYDPNIPIEQPTGRWLVLKNEFFTFWDGVGEPPSWAIYFGFVKQEMTPLFYFMENPRSAFVFNPRIGKPEKRYEYLN